MDTGDPDIGHNRDCDIAILGGGLSGGLIALALHRARPDLRVRLIEAGETFGGNHIWSFFASDVDADGLALLDPMIGHRWADYEVRFPKHRRVLATPYHSIRSTDFDRVLREELPADWLMSGAEITEASADAVALGDGRTLSADAVLDCRGTRDFDALRCGWQKFVGLELALDGPHGLARPIVMDATVEQIDGYRFVYVLPFAQDRLFVEDTYYSDGPALDAVEVEERALAYARGHGWAVREIVHREKGVLPVAYGGDFEAFAAAQGDLAKAGMRGGLFHPTTGYTLPDAVRTALRIADEAAGGADGAAMKRVLDDHASALWEDRGFYRMLDTMLFRGATTADRYKIFQRFYRLNAGLIERFYAGRSTLADKARVLIGKPPIPIHRGVRALMEKEQG